MQTLQTIMDAKTVLTRQASCYNPYYFQGREVSAIVFFKDGHEVFSTRWFSKPYRSNNDYPDVYFLFEIKKKRKVDLNSKEAFCVSENGLTIYIPCHLVNYKDLGEQVSSKSDTAIHYHQVYEIEIFATMDDYEKDDTVGRGYKEVKREAAPRTVQHTIHTRVESTDFGKQVQELEAELKEKHILSDDRILDIKEFLKRYSITKKNQ